MSSKNRAKAFRPIFSIISIGLSLFAFQLQALASPPEYTESLSREFLNSVTLNGLSFSQEGQGSSGKINFKGILPQACLKDAGLKILAMETQNPNCRIGVRFLVTKKSLSCLEEHKEKGKSLNCRKNGECFSIRKDAEGSTVDLSRFPTGKIGVIYHEPSIDEEFLCSTLVKMDENGQPVLMEDGNPEPAFHFSADYFQRKTEEEQLTQQQERIDSAVRAVQNCTGENGNFAELEGRMGAAKALVEEGMLSEENFQRIAQDTERRRLRAIRDAIDQAKDPNDLYSLEWELLEFSRDHSSWAPYAYQVFRNNLVKKQLSFATSYYENPIEAYAAAQESVRNAESAFIVDENIAANIEQMKTELDIGLLETMAKMGGWQNNPDLKAIGSSIAEELYEKRNRVCNQSSRGFSLGVSLTEFSADAYSPEDYDPQACQLAENALNAVVNQIPQVAMAVDQAAYQSRMNPRTGITPAPGTTTQGMVPTTGALPNGAIRAPAPGTQPATGGSAPSQFPSMMPSSNSQFEWASPLYYSGGTPGYTQSNHANWNMPGSNIPRGPTPTAGPQYPSNYYPFATQPIVPGYTQ